MASSTQIAQARHADVYQEVDAAKAKLRAGDVEGAMVNLMAADQGAATAVLEYRGRYQNGKHKRNDNKCANELMQLRGKIAEVAETVKPGISEGTLTGTLTGTPAGPSVAPAIHPSPAPVQPKKPSVISSVLPKKAPKSRPKAPTSRPSGPVTHYPRTPKVHHPKETSPMKPIHTSIHDKGGYSRAGGYVQAPPGAGMYMRVPFQAVDANPVAGAAFSFIAAASAPNFVMQTPQLPWLTYRLRGLVIERQSDAAGAVDSITVEDLREQGGPNLVIGEGRVGVESFRMGDRHLVGMRYNPIVQAPNFLEVRIRGNGFGQNGNTAGNTLLYVSAIIETIEDSTYGKINSLTERLNLGHFGGGQGMGYVFPSGAPVSGTVQRVPMRTTTAGAGALGASSFRLNNANNQIVLQSEQISWAELQIVGIEFGTPIKSNALDAVLFEDLQVGGGASLFAQAGEVPAINFLGDESGRGGGAHSMVGLRSYPLLSATNTATMTVQGRVGSTGAAGLTGTVDIPYVNILVDRLVDDVFGVQPQGARSPYAKAAGLLP